ncbi:hypothetical protein BJX66DRAFT_301663 [Aspergillus keveii]|uniref:Uncharacterized protein n=1 Tax=Aspergillus keveii TaxID=714993 RepID=A0ABR4G9K4_9EURO
MLLYKIPSSPQLVSITLLCDYPVRYQKGTKTNIEVDLGDCKRFGSPIDEARMIPGNDDPPNFTCNFWWSSACIGFNVGKPSSRHPYVDTEDDANSVKCVSSSPTESNAELDHKDLKRRSTL